MGRFGRRGRRDGDAVLTRAGAAIAAAGTALLAAALMLWHATPLDRALFDAIHLARGDPLIAPAGALSRVRAFPAMLLAVIASATLLARRRRIGDAVRLVAGFAIVRVVVAGAKSLVHRPRPPLAGRWQHVGSWSFPSSHAADAALMFVLLALLWARRPVAFVAAIGAAGAIGWTRVALGVHYPSDVVAGWGVGLICAGLAAIAAPGPAMR